MKIVTSLVAPVQRLGDLKWFL